MSPFAVRAFLKRVPVGYPRVFVSTRLLRVSNCGTKVLPTGGVSGGTEQRSLPPGTFYLRTSARPVAQEVD